MWLLWLCKRRISSISFMALSVDCCLLVISYCCLMPFKGVADIQVIYNPKLDMYDLF